ncbi:S24 family peptidase [Patescibacteria group bacterium]|nr:S24 family peptidase [Patescibacteria group bacterium]
MKNTILPVDQFRAAAKYLIAKYGIMQSVLAKETGKPRSQVNDVLQERTSGPEEWRQKVAEYFGLTYEDMLGLGRKIIKGEGPAQPKKGGKKIKAQQLEALRSQLASGNGNVEAAPTVTQVPLISWVQAGDWKDAIAEEVEEYIASEFLKPNLFALKVKGDSMEPRFHEGDILVIDPEADWGHDSFVIIRNGDFENTFKQLKIYENIYVLHPLNPEYPDKVVKEYDIQIVGKVVEKISRERLP